MRQQGSAGETFRSYCRRRRGHYATSSYELTHSFVSSESPFAPGAATFVRERIHRCGPNEPEGLEFTTVAEQLHSLECHGDPFIVIFPTASAVSPFSGDEEDGGGHFSFTRLAFPTAVTKQCARRPRGETEEE